MIRLGVLAPWFESFAVTLEMQRWHGDEDRKVPK